MIIPWWKKETCIIISITSHNAEVQFASTLYSLLCLECKMTVAMLVLIVVYIRIHNHIITITIVLLLYYVLY